MITLTRVSKSKSEPILLDPTRVESVENSDILEATIITLHSGATHWVKETVGEVEDAVNSALHDIARDK